MEHSNLKAMVLRSYFKGHYFLIEAKSEDKILWFEHSSAIEKNTELYLQIINRQ